jgi:hypothetical protein
LFGYCPIVFFSVFLYTVLLLGANPTQGLWDPKPESRAAFAARSAASVPLIPTWLGTASAELTDISSMWQLLCITGTPQALQIIIRYADLEDLEKAQMTEQGTLCSLDAEDMAHYVRTRFTLSILHKIEW